MPYVVVELEAVHCWLGNWTIENSEKASEKLKEIKSESNFLAPIGAQGVTIGVHPFTCLKLCKDLCLSGL